MRERDIEVKLFLKYGTLLIGILWLMATEVFAFSIGDLQVRSHFGEKFNASFEIYLDFDGAMEVGLGDEDDYAKLGLERQNIVNALNLERVQTGSGLKSMVKILSNYPLFFPSFNLVVWVTHNGGTLLENFLVTADFQQSLALNADGKKKKTTPEELPKHHYEPAASQEKVSLLTEAQQLVKGDWVVKKELKVKPERQTCGATNDNKISCEESIVPTPIKTEVKHRRRLSGVIWANPRPNPELVATAAEEPEKVEVSQSLMASKEEYVLQKGETLFSVARKLKIGNYYPSQITATIWLHNIDKFMFGNIHGILEGVKLDLRNLEEYISSIDLETAGNILKNQAVEWKLIKSAIPLEEVTKIAEVSLPSEKLEDLDELFAQVKAWQATWEKMDIEDHLNNYQALEKENQSLINKRQLLARYPKSHIEIFSKFMMLKEDTPVVFFKQVFFSEKLKSWGLKELDWARSSSGWKIREENFYEWLSLSEKQLLKNSTSVENRINKKNTISFVIHVSSHLNKSLAVSTTNQLRKNGFDAYWTPVRISKDIFIYRVYVGRFSDWKQAHRLVRILRKKPLGINATAIPYPLTLQVGEVKSLQEARILLKSLRKSSFSGLLLVSYNETMGILFRVVVGAFKKADNATWMLQKLKKFGFIGELISP